MIFRYQKGKIIETVDTGICCGLPKEQRSFTMDKTIIRRVEKELGMIRFDHVSKLYGDKEALSDVNMTIANGEIFGLIGHNGAGKNNDD